MAELPVMSYNFHVIMGDKDFRASKVSNIGQSVELEEFIEGGYGRRILAKPRSTLPKLVFERGYCSGATGLQAHRLLGVPHPDSVMQIRVYDSTNTKPLKTYMVSDWMITQWRISDLDAISGRILIETVEVTYTTMTVEAP